MWRSVRNDNIFSLAESNIGLSGAENKSDIGYFRVTFVTYFITGVILVGNFSHLLCGHSALQTFCFSLIFFL